MDAVRRMGKETYLNTSKTTDVKRKEIHKLFRLFLKNT